MSAITGILYRDGRSVDSQKIKKMNDRLSHRGPDGSNTWCEGSVALGHQMLHTTPESLHEKLPCLDKETRLVITADARIDNRKELSELLELENNETVSDSTFILKAYERWGESCAEKLLGDFTFVIWDSYKETLFCARDHMGVKPFYYYISNNLFLVASEIKALFCIPEVPQELNELKIAYSLGLLFHDREITFYNNIFRLPAAHTLTINLSEFNLKQYWTLDPLYNIVLDSEEDYIKAFSDIFTEAITCRLRSAYPIGSMLSGGLDSSSISCVAQKILKNQGKQNLNTFSAIFDSVPKSNERNFIEKVLSSDNFNSNYIAADKISPLSEINRVLWYGEDPAIAPNTFLSWNIYREASKRGSKILLDGLEGDITLSHGNGLFTELASNNRWKKLLHEIGCRSKRLQINPYKTFLETCLSTFTPKYLKKIVFINKEVYQKYGSHSRIIKKEFAKDMQLFENVIEYYENIIKINNAHNKHYCDLKSGFIQYEMEFVDKMSAPFSIELRHPFFDKRLVEFCLAIPTEQKFSNGWDRVIMRRAMEGIIPKDVQWRKKKTKLSHNFNQSLIKYDKKLLEDIIFKNTNMIDKYVNIKLIQHIYNEYQLGNTKELIHLWNAVILSIWLQNDFTQQSL